MKRLDCEDIEALQQQQISTKGGLHGVRDRNLLEAAVAAPYSSFGGVEFFPTLAEKGARLCYGLVSSHPFNDGNKRIGVVSFLVLLDLNGIDVNTNNRELIELGLGLAAGSISYDEMLAWLKARMTPR